MLERREITAAHVAELLSHEEKYWQEHLEVYPHAEPAVADLARQPFVYECARDFCEVPPPVRWVESRLRLSMMLLHYSLGTRVVQFLFNLDPVQTVTSLFPLVVREPDHYRTPEAQQTTDGEEKDYQASIAYTVLTHLALECFPTDPVKALLSLLDEIPMPYSLASGIVDEFQSEVSDDTEILDVNLH